MCTGTDGKKIVTSCLWNEEYSGQAQIIWEIQEFRVLYSSSITQCQIHNIQTFFCFHISKRPDPTLHLFIWANTAAIQTLGSCQLACGRELHMTLCCYYYTNGFISHQKELTVCSWCAWKVGEKKTWDLHPFDCSEEESLDKKRNPTPALFSVFQHEQILLVFSSDILSHIHHPQCFF